MRTYLAPAFWAASLTARRSTAVTPEGMQMTTRGLPNRDRPMLFWKNHWSILAVMSKSAMTPSFKGRMAMMDPGVLPMTSLAACPTYFTTSVRTSTATTDGSRMMIPLPFI